MPLPMDGSRLFFNGKNDSRPRLGGFIPIFCMRSVDIVRAGGFWASMLSANFIATVTGWENPIDGSEK